MQKAWYHPFLRLLTLVTLCLFFGCSDNTDTSQKISAPAQLDASEHLIGVPQGAAAMTASEAYFKKAKLQYYDSLAAGYLAVQHGKIDAFIFDRHNLEYIIQKNPELALLPEKIAEEHIVVGAPPQNKELLEKVNRFIAEYRANGTYAAMRQRWFSIPSTPMPELPEPENPDGVITVGTEGLNEPMNYYGADGKLTGFDLEFIRRLALDLNIKIEVKAMTFEALLASVESGKIDLLIANLNATPERKDKILFSDDYVDSAIVALVRKDRMQQDTIISQASDLNAGNYTIGSEVGISALKVAETQLPKAKLSQFTTCADLFQALAADKIDAIVFDKPALDYAALDHPEFIVLPETLSEGKISIGGSPQSTDLMKRVNQFIKEYRENGTYDEMYNRWIKSLSPVMPEISKLQNPAGTLVVGTTNDNMPMSFIGEDGNVQGFDIELIQRLAGFLNMNCKIVVMDYQSLFESCASGKIDLAIANLDATDGRRQSMLFSDSYIDSPIAVMIRRVDYKELPRPTGISSLRDLQGKKAASLTGASFQQLTEPLQAGIEYVFFNDNTSCVQALRTGKVAAVLLDEPVARLFAAEFPEELRVAEVYASDRYGFAFVKGSPLLEQASKTIREMKSSGELQKLIDKWCGNSPEKNFETWTHNPNFTGKKGTLRFASDPVSDPMCYMSSSGGVIGLDVELMRRIAYDLDMNFEFVPMSFSSLIEALFAGKADAVGGAMSITEERKLKVDFAECYYEGGLSILAQQPQINASNNTIAADATFLQTLLQSFDRTFWKEGRWKLVAKGLGVTIVITVLAAILGTFLAFGICAMRRSTRWYWNILGKWYVSLMQGTPILVILMILYYVVFAKVNIDAVLVAVIGFGINFAAYAGEMLRTGIDAVPPGQIEAAKALSLTPFQTYRKVVLPQAARQIIPVYRGEFINMLKTTSVVGYIAIQDLTKMSDIIRSRTYEAFFPLISTAVIYFAVAWLLASGIGYFERRLDPKKRRQAARRGAKK